MLIKICCKTVWKFENIHKFGETFSKHLFFISDIFGMHFEIFTHISGKKRTDSKYVR